MAATNIKSARSHVYTAERLAGGFGPRGAKQPAEAQLRRLVLSCLLWEDVAYADGQKVVDGIRALVPEVAPSAVAQIAVEARFDQKLRHVPLLICREMARREAHKDLVAKTLARVIHRPDELCEFLSLYWKDNGKKTLSAQVKRGLAEAFTTFDEYQLSKWDRDGKEIRLRDVLFLCHAKPKDEAQAAVWKRLVDKQLVVPDTWEVGLSAAKSEDEKRAVWSRLIEANKLPAFAFLKNLRNMQTAKLPSDVIVRGFESLKPTMLLPLDFLKAAQYAPDWLRELEAAMLRCAQEFPKLKGRTVFVVDVSSSMNCGLSSKSEFNRIDAAAALAVLATEMSERISVYATAGSDYARKHATEKLKPYRGFALSDAIRQSHSRLGGGGIFTRQCLEYIREQETETPDRIVIFSDSQDCDLRTSKKPAPFGRHNYIVDVSSHSHGVNYDGVWTAEVSGWSEHFLRFIAAAEAQTNVDFSANTGLNS